MFLSEIRERMLDWLDDPQKDQFDDPEHLQRLLFDAYTDIVHVIDESSGEAWNMFFPPGDDASPGNIFTWPVGKREVQLSHTRAAKIFEVVPLDPDGREGRPFTIVPFRERNLRQHSSGIYIVSGFSEVSLTVSSWQVGLCDQRRTKEIKARVYYRVSTAHPSVQASQFKSDNDRPDLVPLEYHPLIAIRAALTAKIQAKREYDDLAALWAEGKAQLTSFTSSMGHSGSYRV